MSNNTNFSEDLSACKKDEFFFFEDVYFLVGNVIFRLPRHHFEEGSTKFRDMFGLPGSPVATSSANHVTKENPLHRLPDIDVQDFRQFLRVLYPRHFEDEKLTPPQWIAVLKLATTWEFGKVRQLAIKALEDLPLNGISRLALAQDYLVKEWIRPALRLLVEKNEFKDEWMDKIGKPTTFKVISLQGHVSGFKQRASKAGSSATKEELSKAEIDMFIDKIFPELVDASNMSSSASQENGTTGGSGGSGSKRESAKPK